MRKRAASISEPLQPLRGDSIPDRGGFPTTVYIPSGGILRFHGIAPITGDGLYRGYNNKGELKHAIVVNPDGYDHQRQYFHSHKGRV